MNNWVWRSLVACLNGVQEAGSSNLLTQTCKSPWKHSVSEGFSFVPGWVDHKFDHNSEECGQTAVFVICWIAASIKENLRRFAGEHDGLRFCLTCAVVDVKTQITN